MGGCVLLSNGLTGWNPQALLLPSPLVILRYHRGVARLFAADSDAPFHTSESDPLDLVDEVLARLKEHLPKAGPKAPKPSFPLAAIAATYEFGRRFTPHQDAFPHAESAEQDEFFAAFFIDAYKPDSQGGTERIGYAGTIPEGWMPNAPRLVTAPPGHEAPQIVPHHLPIEAHHELMEIGCSFEEYESKIVTIKEYLAAGDIYQANLTVPIRGRTIIPPEALFDNGLKRGGASYGAMMLTAQGTIVSFSPELYIRRRGLDIETRPIKGTRRIAMHLDGLSEATEALKTSPKDHAEHVMIVDLERNDLGRICRYGSVEADPLMKLVEHPTVLHMESTVKGTLNFNVSSREIFAATFPGGSVTGAPKKRALEILGELEVGPRGIYCGAMGWIDCDGDCELNLPIRTAFIHTDGRVDFHSGGGIVADSDPHEEWEELNVKARFFEQALEAAERGESGRS